MVIVKKKKTQIRGSIRKVLRGYTKLTPHFVKKVNNASLSEAIGIFYASEKTEREYILREILKGKFHLTDEEIRRGINKFIKSLLEKQPKSVLIQRFSEAGNISPIAKEVLKDKYGMDNSEIQRELSDYLKTHKPTMLIGHDLSTTTSEIKYPKYHTDKEILQKIRKMNKSQIIEYLQYENDKNNPQYKMSRNFLKYMYRMTDAEIDNATIGKKISKIENEKLRQDLSLYYKGALSASDVIQKWKSKGYDSEAKVFENATRGTYDIPRSIRSESELSSRTIYTKENPVYAEHKEYLKTLFGLYEQKKITLDEISTELNKPLKDIKELYRKYLTYKNIPTGTHWYSESVPAGQRSFAAYGHNMFNKYISLRNAAMSDTTKVVDVLAFLFDVLSRHPEFAADILYIIKHGRLSDDFDEIAKKEYDANKTDNVKYLSDLMRKYKMGMTRDQFKGLLMKPLSISRYDPSIMKQKDITYANKQGYIKDIMGDHLDKYKSKPSEHTYIPSSRYDSEVQKLMHERKRKSKSVKPKRKVIKKRVIKRVIKRKPVSKCRCK